VRTVAHRGPESVAQALRRELDELRSQIAALQMADRHRPEYGHERGDPSMASWELDRAVLERLRQRAAEVEQALAGRDGEACVICAQCGRHIHPDRIAVLPGTRLCVRCARAAEAEAKAHRRGG
jgi:RNA polymerase-binding transcription factor DksA